MTDPEARNILGISRSAGLETARRSYIEKRQKLQAQLLPGIPLATRRHAQAELCRLETAWQSIQAGRTAKRATSAKSPKRPTTRKKASRSAPGQPVPTQKPQTLGEAWEQFLSMMPFSRRVTAAVVIVVLLEVFLSLLANLKK